MKAAIYQKMKSEDPSDRHFDPTDIELHCWTVEAQSKTEAIAILEKRWDVPWRDWLVEVVDLVNLKNWLVENNLDCYELVRHS